MPKAARSVELDPPGGGQTAGPRRRHQSCPCYRPNHCRPCRLHSCCQHPRRLHLPPALMPPPTPPLMPPAAAMVLLHAIHQDQTGKRRCCAGARIARRAARGSDDGSCLPPVSPENGGCRPPTAPAPCPPFSPSDICGGRKNAGRLSASKPRSISFCRMIRSCTNVRLWLA